MPLSFKRLLYIKRPHFDPQIKQTTRAFVRSFTVSQLFNRFLQKYEHI